MPYSVLQRYETELRGFLLQRLGCTSLVDDIYQILAERSLKNTRRAPDNPRAYLFQSASNAVNDYYRAQTCRHNYVRKAQLDQELHVDTKSPEQAASAAQTIGTIETALAELPLLTQKIFYLYRLDGLTQQAIADQLGLSRSTVDRRLAKANTHWQTRIKQNLAGHENK